MSKYAVSPKPLDSAMSSLSPKNGSDSDISSVRVYALRASKGSMKP